MNRDDIDRSYSDFLKRCGMMVNQVGNDLPKLAVEKGLDFTWEVGNYGRNSDSTKETLTKSIADMYITLTMVTEGFGIDYAELQKYIDEQLGR